MSLADLQHVVDESIAGANAFTRAIFESNHWDAQRLEDFANEDGSMTVATVGSDGKPHAAVVMAGCADGTFYFTASPHSALLGNLRRDAAIAFTISDKVMGRGTAEFVGRPGDISHLSAQVGNTLQMTIDGNWDVYIYALRLSRIFAQVS
jgi:pyridoxine/pyridoxamine 5'-phosphate oxidase